MIHINGHRGYIGSYLYKALKASSGTDLCWFANGDPEDFAEHSSPADVIVHLAGYSSEPMCSADPEGAWLVNVDKFRQLVEGLGKDQILIYASSASVYAPNLELATETSPLSSSRPYDCTKIVCDTIAQMHINQGKQIIGLRLGTVAGLSEVQRVDTIVNAMTKSACETSYIRCVDPAVRRTILFLPDLAEAVRRIIANPVPGIFNLGSCNTTVGDIARRVGDVAAAIPLVTTKNSNFYDFHLDSSAFVKSYGEYAFTDMDDIIMDLADNLKHVNQGRRDARPN